MSVVIAVDVVNSVDVAVVLAIAVVLRDVGVLIVTVAVASFLVLYLFTSCVSCHSLFFSFSKLSESSSKRRGFRSCRGVPRLSPHRPRTILGKV